MSAATAKAKVPAVVADLEALEQRKALTIANRDRAGEAYREAKDEIARLGEVRKRELRDAAIELRESKADEIDDEVAVVKAELEPLREELAAQQYAVDLVNRDLVDFVIARRPELIDLAKSYSENEVKPQQTLAADALSDLVQALDANRTEWERAWAHHEPELLGDDGRDVCAPEIAMGFRLTSRLPGSTVTDLVEIPERLVQRIHGKPRASLRALLELLATELERRENVGMPAGYVPPSALMGRAGQYLDSVLGGVLNVGHENANGVNSAIGSADSTGFARFVWVAPPSSDV